MVKSAEFLIPPDLSRTGMPALEALYGAAIKLGVPCIKTSVYEGTCDQLWLFGVGHIHRAPAREAHVKSGRRVILWDLGYFGRRKLGGYCRVSIDTDHPQKWLEQTPEDPSRWEMYNIPLRQDYDPEGPIILIGLGRKSRSYLGLPDWEIDTFHALRKRFPERKIIYRPKPGHPSPAIAVTTDVTSSIEQLLEGASLVVCRHSNVAVDAAIAGVPFECEDGAAMWLLQRPFTADNRLSFLRRLAWWQWSVPEAPKAWKFLQHMIELQDN